MAIHVSAELEKARAHYAGLQDRARAEAARSSRDFFARDVSVLGIGARAREAMSQWPHPPQYDWDEVIRRYKGPKTMGLAVWLPGDQLSAVGLATVEAEWVTLRFMDGLKGCSLSGQRAPIALQACTCYAQGCGRTAIRIQPVSQTLITRCQDHWEFVPHLSTTVTTGRESENASFFELAP